MVGSIRTSSLLLAAFPWYTDVIMRRADLVESMAQVNALSPGDILSVCTVACFVSWPDSVQ